MSSNNNTKKLLSAYPWTTSPIIVSAPMAKVASHALVSEVTKAGGLGFIGGGYGGPALEQSLVEAQEKLEGLVPGTPLPAGLGVLCFAADLEAVLPIIAKTTPVAMWLFGAKSVGDYKTWTQRIRETCSAAIWIQTGGVTEAVEIAKTCEPDVLVLQGTDAGGHGPEKGASLIALLPEASDALAAAGYGHIPLVAAGGIVDGRGVAAAVSLGAAGAVMGTRFLAATEADFTHKGYQRAVLAAEDGGQNTVRSKVFDEMNTKGNIWPQSYDGRGVRNLTLDDHQKGVSIEENREKHAAAAQENGGYKDDIKDTRTTVWAGTAVGLVKEVKGAAQIVKDARDQAKRVIDQAKASL